VTVTIVVIILRWSYKPDACIFVKCFYIEFRCNFIIVRATHDNTAIILSCTAFQ